MPAPVVAAAAKFAAKRAAVSAASNKGGSPNKTIWGIAIGAVVFMVLAPILLITTMLASTGGAGADTGCQDPNSLNAVASPIALADIPKASLDAYQKAGKATGIDWTWLAGIGKVESNHGRFGGSKVDADGNIRPKIIGIPLNGSKGTQAIRDTDNGKLDGDTTWDRAVGPMQFIPSTWKGAGKDGNGDGVNDPHNMYDAILATGFYLKASGAPGDMRKAIYAYNHAGWYVDKVAAAAESYRKAAGSSSAASLSGIASQIGSKIDAATDEPAAGAGSSDWIQPMQAGKYILTAKFGQAGGSWSSGYHTGLDYAAPVGVPFYAVADGTVRTEEVGWAGTLIRVNHGTVDGKVVESLYAHSSKQVVTSGQVKQGDLLGLVGERGNVSGPHLHLEIQVNGKAVDPATWLAGAGAPSGGVSAGTCGSDDLTGSIGQTAENGAWGGFQNGKIPREKLCAPKYSSSTILRCDAAEALDELNGLYKAKFGKNLPAAGGYRDYAGQVECRRAKGNLCAKPGTSNHGWGLAVDFPPPLNTFGTAEWKWLKANASSTGWVHPSWAEPGGSKPEPWHWEYGNVS